jgi:lycopene cyclase domain-containing protein
VDSYLNIWYWNPKALLGIKLIGLPLEEYLFIVMLPWMLVGTVMTVKCIEKRYNKKIL